MAIFDSEVRISFGDCDPAGIVFYPNYFRWMDATFHGWLQAVAGGHGALCRQLGARGLGLMDARLSFRAPATEGQRLLYRIEGIDWSARSFAVRYSATEGARLVLEGTEVRGVFADRDGRMTAAEVAPLRALLEKDTGRKPE